MWYFCTAASEAGAFDRAGQVKASACIAIAYLASHHPSDGGDATGMVGPYRTVLLKAGALRALLHASVSSATQLSLLQDGSAGGAGDAQARQDALTAQHACAFGLMQLCTAVGDDVEVSAADLSMLATLTIEAAAAVASVGVVDGGSETVEQLVAGLWLLLRNPKHHRILSAGFTVDPAHVASQAMAGRLYDIIDPEEEGWQVCALSRVAWDHLLFV